MTLWQQVRGEFIDVIAWDETGDDALVWRFPRQGDAIKWGTRHPLTLRDPELGPVRLRGFGSYCLQASDPVALIRSLGGRSPRFSMAAIHDQLRNLIVSRLADLLGEAHGELPVGRAP